MVSIPSTSNRDPSLAELIDYSAKALQRKQPERSLDSTHTAFYLTPVNWVIEGDSLSLLASDPLDTTGDSFSFKYAAPVMPLRQRDMRALADLFDQDEIYSIEEDIQRNLLNRYPEPCWEDDPFDFLKDYL